MPEACKDTHELPSLNMPGSSSSAVQSHPLLVRKWSDAHLSDKDSGRILDASLCPVLAVLIQTELQREWRKIPRYPAVFPTPCSRAAFLPWKLKHDIHLFNLDTDYFFLHLGRLEPIPVKFASVMCGIYIVLNPQEAKKLTQGTDNMRIYEVWGVRGVDSVINRNRRYQISSF